MVRIKPTKFGLTGTVKIILSPQVLSESKYHGNEIVLNGWVCGQD